LRVFPCKPFASAFKAPALLEKICLSFTLKFLPGFSFSSLFIDCSALAPGFPTP